MRPLSVWSRWPRFAVQAPCYHVRQHFNYADLWYAVFDGEPLGNLAAHGPSANDGDGFGVAKQRGLAQ